MVATRGLIATWTLEMAWEQISKVSREIDHAYNMCRVKRYRRGWSKVRLSYLLIYRASVSLNQLYYGVCFAERYSVVAEGLMGTSG